MRTALFVHDHVFRRDPSGRTFSEGKLTDAVFSRYLPVGDRVVVLSRMQDVPDGRDLVPVAAPHVVFHPVRGRAMSRVFTQHLAHNLGCFRILSRKADIAVLRLPSFLGLAMGLTFRLRGKPFACEVVGDPEEALAAARPGLHGRIMGWFNRSASAWLIRRSIGAIYVSRKLSQDFPTRGLCAIASNVELPAAPHVSDTRVRPDGPLRIGTIGSFHNRHKGIDLAIAAVARLRARGIACRYHVLGSGDARPLRSIAESLGDPDALSCDGVRSGGDAVAEWLRNLDIYVQPSRTEGLPRATIEAMAQGLPCIASNVGGLPELLPPEHLFPSEDVEALTDYLTAFVDDSALRSSAGAANAKAAMDYAPETLRARRTAFWTEIGIRVATSKA